MRGRDECIYDTKDSVSHSLLNENFLRAEGFVSCSLMCPQHPELSLAHHLSSVNICEMSDSQMLS